jgi:hypothetical protein
VDNNVDLATPSVKKLTPAQAIKEKCLECSCGDKLEVKLCEIKKCALWSFRPGVKERKTRVLSDEQRTAAGERMKRAREAKNV